MNGNMLMAIDLDRPELVELFDKDPELKENLERINQLAKDQTAKVAEWTSDVTVIKRQEQMERLIKEVARLADMVDELGDVIANR